MSNDKYKLLRVDNQCGTIKATFVINNLSSEEFAEDLDREQIDQRIKSSDLNEFRRSLYIKALEAIDNYELNLLSAA